MNSKRKTIINIILLGFVGLDLVYAIICFFFPEIWYKLIHGADYVDPQGLLQRTASIWVAFAVFQFIAFLMWKKHHYWLAIVAGLRFSEFFADWTYLYFAQDISWSGRLGLLISTPANIIISLFLLISFLKMNKDT